MEYTPSGYPITCDGCDAPIEKLSDDMKFPAPLDVWGANALYIVCGPLPDGSQPCLQLAELSDELYRVVRCKVPGCDGTRCNEATPN
ncbi:hypothetical protein [Nocardia asiatica]|uniref:hypothetical protein n=1 Tax=Nocardia asiatica TaxID=209252 RepID=UPI0002D6D273|nr:hypothetical protein [Nocardia asiatica]